MEVKITMTEEEAQSYFEMDFDELLEADEDSIDFIEQNHFGDLLIESNREGDERYKLWRNLDCNGGGIEVEYCGNYNGYIYNTVFTK